MSIKHALKMSALRLGIEINRYNAVESSEARLFRLFETHHIDTIIDVGANDGGYGKLLRRRWLRGLDTFVRAPRARAREAHRAREQR